MIPYFNNWISKWPTAQDLADADHEDVLAAWKGLGYYSRATRLHEGAKAMIAKASGSPCPLPSKAVELQNFPGIGRYTAGAVSSIAFGEAEPVLDGNVARVLSRQLGLYMDAKDKKASDILWDEADRLIKHVSDTSNASAIPGQWNQALMELGSTVCTPRPQCTECPIQATCRTYKEGKALSAKRQAPTTVPDIEDACTICEPLDTEDLVAVAEAETEAETPKIVTKRQKRNVKQSNTLSSYFAIGTPSSNVDTEDEKDKDSKKRKGTSPESNVPAITRSAQTYCALFPKKVATKKAAEEQSVVCLVELQLPDGHSKWLIEQRPAKVGKTTQSDISANLLGPARITMVRKIHGWTTDCYAPMWLIGCCPIWSGVQHRAVIGYVFGSSYRGDWIPANCATLGSSRRARCRRQQPLPLSAKPRL